MRRIFLFIVLSTIISSALAQSDTLVKSSGFVVEGKKEKKPKEKLVRYNGNQWRDTIEINGKVETPTKRELKKNFNTFIPKETEQVTLNGLSLSRLKARQVVRKNNRDSIRAHKNVWGSILGGPSYTPEASLGVAAAALLTFKFDRDDTTSFRSLLPFGIMVSINKSFMFAGDSEFYLRGNRLRIMTEYAIRYEPDHYFGVGAKNIDGVERSDSTTQYNRFEVKIMPNVLWEVRKNLFVGGIVDYTYYKLSDQNKRMLNDGYIKNFKPNYLNAGLGANVLYDSRDNITMPYSGIRAEVMSIIYGKYLGGKYNFTYNKIEYRQYKRLFNRRSVLAWMARMDITTGDVPITNLATFGSPRDLRGYYKGQYRDKSMAYALVEYRHMFGSTAIYEERRPLWTRLGLVVWAGMGTMGPDPVHFNTLKFNYGVGLRYEILPNSNVRLDVGRGPKGQWLFYMNMIEAF